MTKEELLAVLGGPQPGQIAMENLIETLFTLLAKTSAILIAGGMTPTPTKISRAAANPRWETEDISGVATDETFERQLVTTVRFEAIIPNNYEAETPLTFIVGAGAAGELLNGNIGATFPGARIGLVVNRISEDDGVSGPNIISDELYQTITTDDTETFTSFSWDTFPSPELNPGDRVLVEVELELNSHDENSWGYGYVISVQMTY